MGTSDEKVWYECEEGALMMREKTVTAYTCDRCGVEMIREVDDRD